MPGVNGMPPMYIPYSITKKTVEYLYATKQEATLDREKIQNNTYCKPQRTSVPEMFHFISLL